MHSLSRADVSGQLQVPPALSLEKETPMPIGQKDGTGRMDVDRTRIPVGIRNLTSSPWLYKPWDSHCNE